MRDVLRLSDTLIGELVQTDLILLGAPMYNFGMPAHLKAYVDQIVRVTRTFAGCHKRKATVQTAANRETDARDHIDR